jgi:uncharacterized protein (DUF697 family)
MGESVFYWLSYRILKNSRRKMMRVTTEQQEIITQHVALAAAAAIPGSFIPASDLPALIGIWATMITRIGQSSGYAFTNEHILKQLTAATTGVGFYFGGSKLFGALLHLIPGFGTVTYVTLNAVLNSVFTNRLGKLTAELFNEPGFNLEMLGKALEGLVKTAASTPPSPHEIKESYGTFKHSKRSSE